MNPTKNKKILTAGLILSAILVLASFLHTGCTSEKTITNNADGTSVTNVVHHFDLNKATNAINNVVPAAVRVLAAKEPKSVPYLTDVSVAINGFILQGNPTPDNLRKALASVGMKELRTDEAEAITELVLSLYQTYFGQAVQDNVNQNVNVLPLLKALADGIDKGLASPTANGIPVDQVVEIADERFQLGVRMGLIAYAEDPFHASPVTIMDRAYHLTLLNSGPVRDR